VTVIHLLADIHARLLNISRKVGLRIEYADAGEIPGRWCSEKYVY